MSEAELIQLNKNRNCTLYTIQFITEDKGEYLRFYNRFKNDATYNEDLARMAKFVEISLTLVLLNDSSDRRER